VHCLFNLERWYDSLSEFQSKDETSRTLDGFILGRLAFVYWIDFADRHVKVLVIKPADHGGRER
jgi:hypothetical protein